jgi:hypothetical protein
VESTSKEVKKREEGTEDKAPGAGRQASLVTFEVIESVINANIT